jgi:hypothetical protein
MDSSRQTLSPPLRFILEVSPSFTVTVLSEADLYSHVNVVPVSAHIEHTKYVENGVYELFFYKGELCFGTARSWQFMRRRATGRMQKL